MDTKTLIARFRDSKVTSRHQRGAVATFWWDRGTRSLSYKRAKHEDKRQEIPVPQSAVGNYDKCAGSQKQLSVEDAIVAEVSTASLSQIPQRLSTGSLNDFLHLRQNSKGQRRKGDLSISQDRESVMTNRQYAVPLAKNHSGNVHSTFQGIADDLEASLLLFKLKYQGGNSEDCELKECPGTVQYKQCGLKEDEQKRYGKKGAQNSLLRNILISDTKLRNSTTMEEVNAASNSNVDRQECLHVKSIEIPNKYPIRQNKVKDIQTFQFKSSTGETNPCKSQDIFPNCTELDMKSSALSVSDSPLRKKTSPLNAQQKAPFQGNLADVAGFISETLDTTLFGLNRRLRSKHLINNSVQYDESVTTNRYSSIPRVSVFHNTNRRHTIGNGTNANARELRTFELDTHPPGFNEKIKKINEYLPGKSDSKFPILRAKEGYTAIDTQTSADKNIIIDQISSAHNAIGTFKELRMKKSIAFMDNS